MSHINDTPTQLYCKSGMRKHNRAALWPQQSIWVMSHMNKSCLSWTRHTSRGGYEQLSNSLTPREYPSHERVMSHMNDTPLEGKTIEHLFGLQQNIYQISHKESMSHMNETHLQRAKQSSNSLTPTKCLSNTFRTSAFSWLTVSAAGFFLVSTAMCFWLACDCCFGQKHIGLFCGYVGLFWYQQTCASQSALPGHLPQFRIRVGIGTWVSLSYIYMYIHTYMYIYERMYIYVYTYIYMCMCVSASADCQSLYALAFVCERGKWLSLSYTYLYIYIHVCMYIYIHICIYIFVCVCVGKRWVRVFLHMYTCIYPTHVSLIGLFCKRDL